MQARTVRVFLVDGTPTGILIVDIQNFSGKVIVSPRLRLAEVSTRADVNKTGVYCLVGEDPADPDRDLVYFGETDHVLRRLSQHDREEKTYDWTRAVLIVTSDENLTKAHVRYLESRLIELAKRANRARVMNDTAPPRSALPESDTVGMEQFIENLELQLSVLGLNFLRPRTNVATNAKLSGRPSVDGQGPIVNLKQLPRTTATDIAGEFIVIKGSVAFLQAKPSWTAYRALRDRLLHEGKLAIKNDSSMLEFTQDVSFKSPSAAAAVALGRNSNGRTEWRVSGSTKTYQEWSEETSLRNRPAIIDGAPD